MDKAITNWTDNDLIQGYLAGDDNCFEIILTRYKSRLFTVIYLIVRDRDIADDLFQDTMIKIVHRLRTGKYTEEGKFFPWASRIARNLAIDHFRKKQKIPMLRDTEDYSLITNLNSSDMSIDNTIIKRENARYIRTLIQMLPDKQREVLIMRSFADLSFREISELTNISINTVLGRMRYALINLKKFADDAGFPHDSHF